jgi:hypothetical protein
MSGDPRIVGPLSAIGTPLADAGQRFAASGPFNQAVGIACLGAITLSFCGETAAALGTATLSSWSPIALCVFAGGGSVYGSDFWGKSATRTNASRWLFLVIGVTGRFDYGLTVSQQTVASVSRTLVRSAAPSA